MSLKTCPASFNLLDLIVFDILSREPYSVALFTFSFQLMFNTFLSIRVYVPSSAFSSRLVRDQVELPYRRIVSVVALKSCIFIFRESLLLQTLFSLWSDFHANAFRVLISLSWVHQLPSYIKSSSPVTVSACLISVPSMLCNGWMLML